MTKSLLIYLNNRTKLNGYFQCRHGNETKPVTNGLQPYLAVPLNLKETGPVVFYTERRNGVNTEYGFNHILNAFCAVFNSKCSLLYCQ